MIERPRVRGTGPERVPVPPERIDREAIELSLLLEGVYRQYGFDFREYAPASLKRRVWRRVLAEHTGTMIAAAFGGGVLLAAMVSGRSDRASLSQAGDSEPARQWRTGTKHEVLENVDSIKSALVGAAATKLKGFLGEIVPGFKEHLATAEVDRGREPTH